jgi:Zn finger protein HypA/HybF involved in hydrogenase expression
MMHETAIVSDLLARAEAEVPGDSAIIATLKFQIGALSGVTPRSLRQTADRLAFRRWGYIPELDIEESHDPTDSNALGVVLVSVRLEA